MSDARLNLILSRWTDEASSLYTRYQSLARAWSRRMEREHGARVQDWESLADDALIAAAGTFDPAERIDFATYFRFVLRRSAAGARRSGATGLVALDATPDPVAPGNALADIEDAEANRHAVRSCLRLIREPWQVIVAMRFGLDGHEPMTMQAIGRRLGCSHQWVRSVETRALTRMAGRG